MTKFFKPAPLLAPTLGLGLKAYMEYLSAYDLYQNKLEASRASWKQTVNDRESRVKAAVSRGCVLKVDYSTEKKEIERTVLAPGEGFRPFTLNMAATVPKVKFKEAPQAPPPKPEKQLSPEQKKAKAAAKKRRHRKNVALKKAKQDAKLTLWQARAKVNRSKMTGPDSLGSKSKAQEKGKAPKGPPFKSPSLMRLETGEWYDDGDYNVRGERYPFAKYPGPERIPDRSAKYR